MAWIHFWQAIALVFVIEGILPFLKPDAMRKAWATMMMLSDRTIRITGFISMIVGVLLLYAINYYSGNGGPA